MLPKIEAPVFETTIPSGKIVKFRPFFNKEQKNLLILSEGGESLDVYNGIVNLVNICTFEKIDWLKMTGVDLEWMFLQIRSKSIGEIVEMAFRCLHKNDEGETCNTKNHIDVDIREAVATEKPNLKIVVNEKISIFFEELTVDDTIDLLSDRIDEEELIFRKVKYVTEGESLYTEFSKPELIEFLDGIPKKAAEDMADIFQNDPTLKLDIKTKCVKCSNEGSIEVKGVLNFFG